MRDLALTAVLLGLLLIAFVRPFVGVLLWSWVAFMNPHQVTWGFASTMPWAMIIFCATLVGCLVGREPRRLQVNAVNLLLLLFLFCITATSLVAQGNPEMVWHRWEWVSKVILGVLLASLLLDDERRIHAMVWLIVIALGYYGVRGGIFTLVTGGGFIVMGPPNTVITDRNQLAVGLLVALPLMNYLRLHSRHRIVRLGLAAAMVFTLFAVIGTQSRGALVGLVAAGGVFWLRSRGKLLSGALVVAAMAAVLAFMPESWWARMETIERYTEDGSAMGRIQIWIASWKIAVANPLTGGGFMAMYQQPILDIYAPGTTRLAAHSIWLEVLGEHGFPTFFVWLSILLAGAYYALRITRLARGRPDLLWAGDLARMAQASMVAYCAAGSLLSLSYWDMFWTLMVILGATHAVCVAARRSAPVAGGRATGEAGWRARAQATPVPAASARRQTG